MDAMHGMLKQEGGVNKANLMGSEPKLTFSAPLEKGEDSDEPVWLVLTRALSAGSCFIDRPYCAASPQASHRACPALGLATKEIYTKDLRLVSPFSRTVRTDPYGASGNPPGTSPGITGFLSLLSDNQVDRKSTRLNSSHRTISYA